MRHVGVFARDHDGGFEKGRVMGYAMRAASGDLIGLEQVVEAARDFFVRGENDDAQLLLYEPGDEPAGDLQLGFGV